MGANEIHLNRKAINSIELPAQVQAEAGTTVLDAASQAGSASQCP